MKDVQCYELFGGIALKNHAFSFFFTCVMTERMDDWNPPESLKRITCIMMINAGHQNKEITGAAQCSMNTVKTISHDLENSDGDYEAVARG